MAVLRSLTLLFLTLLSYGAATGSPISKVIQLLSEMQDKVKNEGVEADETMKEDEQFFYRRGDDLSYSIKTSTNDKEELEARISKAAAKIDSIANTLQETYTNIESNKADVEAAADVRKNEKATFDESEKELLDTMDSLKRAVGVLEKEAAKQGAASPSLIQVQKAPEVIAAVEAVVSGAMIGAADAAGLTAFLQSSEEASEFQAPTPPAYESKSGGIIEMLEDLQDKAKAELNELRTREEEARHSYQMLRQSLEDEIKFAEAAVAKLKSTQADEASDKASDEKDLKETEGNLKADTKELAELKVEFRRKKEDYEAETKSRAEELTALDAAKAALAEKTGGADAQTYSFLQLTSESSASARAAQANDGVVQMLRDVAHKTNSSSISLLSRRIGNMMRSDMTSGADVFERIKQMISDMIETMQKELSEAADKKAYCDAEMAKGSTKQEGKESDLAKIQTRIDTAASKSAGLKAEVKDLQKALSVLAETEVTVTKLRAKEKKQYEKNEPEIQEGLDGVKTALKVLREFYKGVNTNRGGSANSIVGMLEVVEGDFAKNLAEMRVAEETAVADFKKEQQEMKEEKVRKEQDVKYKTQAFQRLDADLQELQSDTDSLQTELAAIQEFNDGIKAECIVPPETFEEKRQKRQAEIDGLKSALEALSASGVGLLQKKTSPLRLLRGSRATADVLAP